MLPTCGTTSGWAPSPLAVSSIAATLCRPYLSVVKSLIWYIKSNTVILPLKTQPQSATEKNSCLWCDVADQILFIPYSIMRTESAVSTNPLSSWIHLSMTWEFPSSLLAFLQAAVAAQLRVEIHPQQKEISTSAQDSDIVPCCCGIKVG